MIIRKIDNLGRVSIPKGMRDAAGINAGDELEFAVDADGVISMRKIGPEIVEERYRIAAEVLVELGYNVPDELSGRM